MTPERWQQIEALYHAARELPPAEWSAYLASSCPDDPALQREVERLLSQPHSHEGFLAGHARDLAVGLVTHHSGLVNKTLGGYQLQALIGIGGMGEVYRARDVKLGRQVAIKVLPHAFTSDAGRVARFDREARTLAALNHPNICAIHGVEHAGDIRFLVLELVEGQTLADAIASGQPETESASSRLRGSASAAERGGGAPHTLKIDDALRIARQIARALHFAHQRGIVHRDLKPANIKVTADGAVKILDFGLAKATAGDAAGADLEPAPNVTRDGTIEGALLGTPAYMSPEQARGKPVDRRTDIWAFGCVLYEMLTGRPAFHGDTVADTISKVIEREPDWSALPRFTPEPIRKLLVTCLTKDSEKRLQNIDEVTIDDVLSESGRAKTATAHWRVMRPVWLTAAATMALAIAAWIFWPAPKVIRQKLVLPAGQVLDGSGGAHIVTITPDGSELAYVAAPRLLYLWPLASNASEATPVPGTEAFRGVRDVEFSPDGKAVAFYAFAERALMWMPVAGGPYLKISNAETPTGIHWGPDNMVLYGQGRDGIWQASVNAQGATRIAEVQEGEQAHGPWLLPDGDHFLFTIAKGRSVDRWDSAKIVVQSLSTRKRTELGITGSDVRYLPQMRLLIYARSGSLWAIRFDPRTLTTQGTAMAVLERVRRGAAAVTGAAQFRTADDGTLVYVTGPADATPPFLEIAIADDPTGKRPPRKLKAVPDRYETPRLSPDELRVAVGVNPDKGRATIYTVETTGQATRQPVTSPDSDNRFPVWSHDGRRLAFQSNRGGSLAVWSQSVDGIGIAEQLTTPAPGEDHVPESWAADGTLLYSITSKGQTSLWTLPARNGKPGKPARFGNQVSRDPMSAVLSHNGKFVVYTRTDDREVTICIENFPSQFKTQCLQPKLADSPKHPRWSPDDTKILFDPRIPDFSSVEVRLSPEMQFGEPQPVPYHPVMMAPPGARTPYDVTRQGHLVGLIPAGQDVYRNIAPTEIQVVRNWFEELKQKVGWTWFDTFKLYFW